MKGGRRHMRAQPEAASGHDSDPTASGQCNLKAATEWPGARYLPRPCGPSAPGQVGLTLRLADAH